MLDLEGVKQRFREKPFYMKNGAGLLAKKWKVSEEIIRTARKEVQLEGLSLNEFKQANGIKDHDIKGVKFWQNFNGNLRWSIDTKNQIDYDKVKNELLEEISKYKIPELPRRELKHKRNCCVINLYDAHIDKMTLLTESNKESSIEENVSLFETAFDELLNHALQFEPEYIVFPCGNDFFNTNGTSNSTKRGTPQDNLCKSQEAFKHGLTLLRKCIDKAAQYSTVIIPMIKGNHDEDQIFYLGEVLQVLYEDQERVLIQSDRHQRKYFVYGENLLGFGHGDKEHKTIGNLPLLMAEENKEDWAKTTYREWFLGDRHHKFEYKFMRSKDFIGATVRFLRSVSNIDQWHYDHGYIGIPKTAEMFVYNFNKGLIANFSTNI